MTTTFIKPHDTYCRSCGFVFPVPAIAKCPACNSRQLAKLVVEVKRPTLARLVAIARMVAEQSVDTDSPTGASARLVLREIGQQFGGDL